MADQSKLQTSELQFDTFTHKFDIFMLEVKIQDPSKCVLVLVLPQRQCYGIKEVEMVDSVNDFKSSRSIQGFTHFPNF